MNRKNSFGKVLWYACSSVLLLILITTYMLSGLYARYTTATSVENGARVAVYDTSMQNPLVQTYAVTMNPQDSPKTITAEVNNSGEVAMRFTLSIRQSGNLPLVFSGVAPLVDDGENSWYYDSSPGEGENSLSITAQWDPLKKDYEYSGGVEQITLTLSAQQID